MTINKTIISIAALLSFTACKKDNNDDRRPAPQISSFTPDSGARSSFVLISGANFSNILSENKVSINGAGAKLISTTGTSLLIEVPPSAGTGKIAVTVNGRTDSSASNFNYQAAVSFVAGSMTMGYADGKAADAQFSYPTGLTFDNKGNLLIAVSSRLRQLSPDAMVSTIAGTGAFDYLDGPAAASNFRTISDIVTDPAGNIYISDQGNYCIRKISTNGMVSTLAGSAGYYDFKDGLGSAARFNYPAGITIDQTGNLFVADAGNNCIRKITQDGNVSVFAGTKTSGYADGTGTAARFKSPSDVVADAAGNLYVSDVGNYSIRKITPAGVVTTIAGSSEGYKDGPKNTAQFGRITQLCLDKTGNILLCDYDNKVVRKISTTGIVTTIAGNPNGENIIGPAGKVNLLNLQGIAVAPSGLVYFADQFGIKTVY